MEDKPNPFIQYGFKDEKEFIEFIEKKLDYLEQEGVVGVNEHGKYVQKTVQDLNKEMGIE